MTGRRIIRFAFFLGLLSTTSSLHSEPPAPREQPDETPFSVIVLNADRLIFRDDRSVVFPNDPDAIFFGGVYQAHIRSIETLSGPEISRNAVIMFAGNHLEDDLPFKVFMVVRPDEDGYWGGQQWREVKSRLCLDDGSIADWKLETAFAKAKRQKSGERCIRI